MKTTYLFIPLLIVLTCTKKVSGQDTISTSSGHAVEVRVTTYLQNGWDGAYFFYPQNSRFSFGILAAGHDINGSARGLLFKSSDIEALDIRLTGIVSLLTRYHFASSRKGLFAELGAGAEEFRVTNDSEVGYHTNGFIAPAIGFMWYPFKRAGFYVLPKVNGVLTIARGEEQVVSGVSYHLKGAFVTPAIAVGLKF